eukprot:Em0008g115a
MRTQTDEVKGLLTQNIEKVIQRGDRLDQLEDRAGKEQAYVVPPGRMWAWQRGVKWLQNVVPLEEMRGS